MTGPRLAFFGSSLVSSYWNGAATYYRGLFREMSARGWQITFYEPDAYGRQERRDIEDPDWARVVVYEATATGLARALEQAVSADMLAKASGVGVFDDELERALPAIRRPGQTCIFWDVDAPATLAHLRSHPDAALATALPEYDLVLTYGGGAPVVDAYRAIGARECIPVYNALDPTTHHPVESDSRYTADLSLLANRLPDREARIGTFFRGAAQALPGRSFLLGGSGWDDWDAPANVRIVGHVYTRDHNAFNCSALAVLNVSRESMAATGYSPATRVFEAAGAGACLITDAWHGIDEFLEPDREVLVAGNGDDVARHLASLTPERAREVGEAARRRVLREHTYRDRVEKLEQQLGLVRGVA